MTEIRTAANIQKLRKEVDRIDAKIAQLLKQRIQLASRVISEKEKDGSAAKDRLRERAIAKHYANTLKRPINETQVLALVNSILRLTPEYRDSRQGSHP